VNNGLNIKAIIFSIILHAAPFFGVVRAGDDTTEFIDNNRGG
jgi:hypothetical protein